MDCLSRWFGFEQHGTTLRRELLAGLTTFSTMAYAILLLPSILSETGMDFESVMMATLITGAFATIFMGFLANYPFVLAPGLALAAYFAYSVVGAKGYTWELALGVVFLTGILFLLLNLLRIRQLIIKAIPLAIRLGTTAGLGLFLAFIGLKNVGVVVKGDATLLSFGNPNLPTVYLTALGVVVMGTLMRLRVPGAIFLGILFGWIVGLIFNLTEWRGIVSWPGSLAPTFFKLDVRSVFDLNILSVFISFVFVSLFDTSGTLVALAEEAGFISDETPKGGVFAFPRLSRALTPDATGSILGSFLGTSTLAVYLESAAGIAAGGRTGLTSVTVGVLFLISLFFGPFAHSIPPFATAPALLIIGGMMLKKIYLLDWKDPSEWIPSFAVLLIIPMTFSVANGIAIGFILMPLIKLFSGRVKEVHWLAWILGALFILKFFFFPFS